MVSYLVKGSRIAITASAALMIALVAFGDSHTATDIPLGFLYLFPMALLGNVLNVWQVGFAAAVCTLLTEMFDEFTWAPNTGLPRDILYFMAFFGIGVFVFVIRRNRAREQQHLREIELQSKARSEAEEQLKVLIESSPAAVFTATSEGQVLLANDAAHRLFGVPPSSLPGRSIHDYLPSLVNVPASDGSHQSFRTVMQSRGHREDGDVFLADIWFSTYCTSTGARLAAMVVDASEDLRTREESSLHQLLAGSRILVGAVSHEIRNVCGAIAVVRQNLARSGALSHNKDFEALGNLVLALEKIAGVDLRQTANQTSSVYLPSILEELRIIVEPALREDGITTEWGVDPGVGSVWADRQSLMQVFLNLVNNSARAMRNRPSRRLKITAHSHRENITVTVSDTGGGVPHPDRLFKPFQQEAKATGLGLYLSRAFMRSFRGDLRYAAEPEGSSFLIELLAVAGNVNDVYDADNANSSSRRSQFIPGEPESTARS
jgi:two-component system sensor kinase FixL